MTYARKGSLNCAYPQKKTKKFCYLEKTSYLCSRKHRGVEQLVARQAHNLEVTRSSRVSATKSRNPLSGVPAFFCYFSSFFSRIKAST